MLHLDRYQVLMRLPINAFNGLNKPTEGNDYQCSTIWKQSERENLGRFLAQAQSIREQQLNFKLQRTALGDEADFNTKNPHILAWKKLYAIGKMVTVDVADVALALRDIYDNIIDPLYITQAVTFTDTREAVFYKPGTDQIVNPTSITISGGILTARIPRARIVDPDYLDDREDSLDYYDDSVMLDTLELKREYIDPAQGVEFHYRECSANFTYSIQTGYGEITDSRLAIIRAYPATWTDGVPSRILDGACHHHYEKVVFHYVAGENQSDVLDLQTCRLAHTLMPVEPCSCDPVHQYWLNDNVRDPSNNVTPYGASVAAVDTWAKDYFARVAIGGYTIGGLP